MSSSRLLPALRLSFALATASLLHALPPALPPATTVLPVPAPAATQLIRVAPDRDGPSSP